MLKRLLCAFFALCILIVLSPMPAAAAAAYRLDALGLQITPDDSYVVLTREAVQNGDVDLSVYGMSNDDLYAHMLEYNVYIYVWDPQRTFEFFISMEEPVSIDFNQMDDTALHAMSEIMMQSFEKNGVMCTEPVIYEHSQTKFISLMYWGTLNDKLVHGIQYSTVYNDKTINMRLLSYNNPIDEQKKAMCKKLVDSVVFDPQKQPDSPPPAQTPSFVYTDDDTGISFTVPANWVEKPLEEEYESLDAQFSCNLDETLRMIFAGRDVWASLTPSEKQQYTRSEMNNDALTKADIADMLKCSESDVSLVTLGGKEYYCASITKPEDFFGFTISVPITYYLRCENGCIAIFIFGGLTDSPYYSDFEAMIESAVYPNTNQTPSTDPAVPQRDPDSRQWAFAMLNILLSVVVTIGIYSVPIVIYRYAIRKKPMPPKQATIVTVICAAAALFLMTTILLLKNGNAIVGGCVVILLSFLNYYILVRGTHKQDQAFAHSPVNPPASHPVYPAFNQPAVPPASRPVCPAFDQPVNPFADTKIFTPALAVTEDAQTAEASPPALAVTEDAQTAEVSPPAPAVTEDAAANADDRTDAHDAQDCEKKEQGCSQDTDCKPMMRYCRICGQPLIEGCKFCSACGTAIKKEL